MKEHPPDVELPKKEDKPADEPFQSNPLVDPGSTAEHKEQLEGGQGSLEDQAGCLSRMLFTWVWGFLQHAYRLCEESHLQLKDLYAVAKSEELSASTEQLRAHWEAETNQPNPSFARAVAKFVFKPFCSSFFLTGITLGALLTTPVLMGKVIDALNGDTDVKWGYIYTAIIVVLTAASSVVGQLAWHWGSNASRQMWLAITLMIFEKPGKVRKSEFTGKITEAYCMNMIAMDAYQLMIISSFWTLICNCPWLLAVSSGLLLWKLGYSALVGMGLLLVGSVVAERLADKYKVCNVEKYMLADKRGSILNESLQGIRTVKLYSWEEFVERNVNEVREKELVVLKTMLQCLALQNFICTSTPTIAVLATFLVYSANNDLSESLVFECVALFEAMGQGFQLVPTVTSLYKQCVVSLARIQTLLDVPELYEPAMLGEGDTELIQITGPAAFSWFQTVDQDSWSLKGVEMTASRGQLIGVVGEVGSGKTTLISGILGLINCFKGNVKLSGRMAYVPQVATILNASVRDNILFGAVYNQERYQQVLHACCLSEDLQQFHNGDETEIGEKGITISGGQRQRIAIARAAYNDTDGVVFDDTLSAMDSHVGGIVFERCFRGLLKDKAVVFATNQLAFCSQCDFIYVLHQGELIQKGTFEQLSSQTGQFTEILHHVTGSRAETCDQQEEEVDDKEIPEPKQEEPEGKPGGEIGESGKKLFTAEDKGHQTMNIEAVLTVFRAADSYWLGIFMLVTTMTAPMALYGTNVALAAWVDGGGNSSDYDLVLVYAGMCLGYSILQFLRGYIFSLFFLNASRTLFTKMLRNVLRQQMTWFDTTPIGRVVNRFAGDMTQIEISMSRLWDAFAFLFGSIATIVIMTCIFVPPVIVVVLAAICGLSFLYKRYSTVACQLQNLTMVATSPMVGAMGSLLGALDTIRIFDRLKHFTQKFKTDQAVVCKCYYWNWSLDRFVMCWAVTFGVCTFIALTAVTLLLFRDSFMAESGRGAVVLTFLTLLAYRTPTAIYTTVQLQRSLSGPQRVAEYTNLPTELDQLPNSETLSRDAWDGGDGSIQFEHVSMRYREGLPLVLSDVSFSLTPGTKCGIVGRTGAGKSSVILCAFRMINAPNRSGNICIGGKDISTLDPSTLRHGLGMIPQDAWMFSGTVRSNLDPLNCYSEQQLLESLELVGLKNTIQESGGLDKEVHEKGTNFSVGTVQLLCIARVLLKKPSVIFMDEATASVDMRTDAAVQETIRSAFSSCTIVTIAHRLQTIIDYDRIIVLDRGRVAENGAPSDLLQNQQGLFSSLVNNTGKKSAAELRSRALKSKESGEAASHHIQQSTDAANAKTTTTQL